MSRAEIEETIRACRFFSQVEPQGMARLVNMARLCAFAKGEMIFRDRQPCPGVYIVVNGLVRVYKVGANGKEHVLHMVGPGNTFAEVAAIGNFDCPANAEAVVAARCVLLPLEPFRKALEEDHAMCLKMMFGLAYWVKHLVGLMEDVVLRDAGGRLARYLLNAPRAADGTIELPTLKRHVASHLNLTSETFSRTLSRLIEAGLVIDLEGNRLELRDERGLRAIAEHG